MTLGFNTHSEIYVATTPRLAPPATVGLKQLKHSRRANHIALSKHRQEQEQEQEDANELAASLDATEPLI